MCLNKNNIDTDSRSHARTHSLHWPTCSTVENVCFSAGLGSPWNVCVHDGAQRYRRTHSRTYTLTHSLQHVLTTALYRRQQSLYSCPEKPAGCMPMHRYTQRHERAHARSGRRQHWARSDWHTPLQGTIAVRLQWEASRYSACAAVGTWWDMPTASADHLPRR